MAALVNARDVALQATSPRQLPSPGLRIVNIAVGGHSSWSDAAATAAVAAGGFGAPQDGDMVTLYDGTGAGTKTFRSNISTNRVVIKWEAAYATAYQVQVSMDGSTWTTVYTTTAGAGGTVDVHFTAVALRYLRLYTTARATIYGASVYEIEVYSATDPGTNLALSATATASSEETSSFTAPKAIDGNVSTRWASLYADPQWLKLDLGVGGWITTTPFLNGNNVLGSTVHTNHLVANAVTQASAVVQPNPSNSGGYPDNPAQQIEVSNSSWGPNILETVVTLSGSNPLLVWATWSMPGTHIGTSTDYNEHYWSNYWKHNTVWSSCEAQFYAWTASSGEGPGGFLSTSIFPGETASAGMTAVFTGLPVGVPIAISLMLRKADSGLPSFAARSAAMCVMEAKR